MSDLTGKQFGPYYLTARLGQGGMGVVYQAYHSAMDRQVAVKVLPTQLTADPQFAVRFRQEALFLARLQHPHVLPVFDYGEAEGCVYLVMPFIRSGTLADRMLGEFLPLPFITTVITQVGDALDYAHAQGLVHRDIKPQNILMDARGNCLLADFGIAKLLEATAHLTHTGGVIGTPAYMSPEQGQGLPIDGRSDVYSLGVVLYQMATGRIPFQATTPMGIVFMHVNKPLPAPRSLNPGLTPAIEAVIRRSLAKQPADRYASAGDLAQALRSAAGSGDQTTLKTTVGVGGGRRLSFASLLLVAGGLGLAGIVGLLLIVGVLILPWVRTPATHVPPSSAVATSQVVTVLSPTAPASATISPTAAPTLIATSPPSAAASQQSPVDGMVQRWVPPGEFIMGSAADEAGARPNEFPRRRVTLDGFWIDQYEVSNAQFADFLNALNRSDREAGAWIRLRDGDALVAYENDDWQPKPGFGQHPVINVSWEGAEAYCQWANRRLPTEAEWEKAARGPDGAIYPWGNAAPTGALANFSDKSAGSTSTEDDSFARSSPVGSFPDGASPYGAFDMAGNVWEWVSDWYSADYYANGPTDNPPGPASGSFRVLRGSSWNGEASLLRAAFRGGDVPSDAVHFDFGFRCAADGEN